MAGSTERAVLAGGCFWGMQELIRRYPGVISTRVGYTGGEVPNATYRNHGNHAEAIEIIFDPAKISYRQILKFFFQIHDPTTRNRQGNDIGASYRSAIFYTNHEQRRVALDTIADVNASGLWPGEVVTEVAPAGPFWEAEPEHQDYLERYPAAIRAISSAPTGFCRSGPPRNRRPLKFRRSTRATGILWFRCWNLLTRGICPRVRGSARVRGILPRARVSGRTYAPMSRPTTGCRCDRCKCGEDNNRSDDGSNNAGD